MPVLYANRATSTLASSITNSATSLSVAAGQGARFPAITAPDYFYATLDDGFGSVEIIKVTARSTDTFTVVRAQDGTSALAFNAGATVELRVVKAMLDDFKADARLGLLTGNQSITLSGDASGSGATAIAVTLASSGVAAGTYGGNNSIPALVVDAKGRVTSASAVTPSGTWGISISGNAATVSAISPNQVSPQVVYTTPADASGYTWIRFEFANGASFNGGQQQIEFYVSRAINDDGASPYGGCTAKFTAQGREWHAGQELMVVQYGEHGQNASGGAGYYITHARVADFAGSGYWIYLRVRSGITYIFREALHGGAGCNFSSLQGTTDPGSAQPIYAGLNLIATSQVANFYNNGSAVLHAGNYTSYSPSLTGGGASGTWGINITGSAGSISNNNIVDYLRITNSGGAQRLLMGNQDSAGVNNPAMIVGVNGQIEFGNGSTWSGSGGVFTKYATFAPSAVNITTALQQSGNQVLHAGNYNSYSPTLTGSGASGSWGISITGSAAYAATSGSASTATRSTIEDTRASQRTPNDYEDYRASYEFTNQLTGLGDWHSVMTMQGWHNNYAAWQIIGPSGTSAHENFYLRSGIDTTWNPARAILHSGNYTSYSPTLTGSGASGTWGISITGNAATATTLQTARTINGVGFNGSANITITAATPNAVTFNSGGAGAASGSTYTGSAALTVSHNTIGAPSTTGANASGTWSISITGNAATATALQTARAINGVNFNGTAAIETSEWIHSGRDFPSGTLIQTTIDYSQSQGDPWILEIKGNSYGNLIPIDIQYQGYIYNDTVINHGGYSNGSGLSGLVLFNYNGKLCFWFPYQVYWQGFNVRAYSALSGRAANRVTSITNEAKPAGVTKELALSANIRQSLHSGNFTSYAPSLTGSGASGTWGISITGNAATITGQANSATITASTGVNAGQIVQRDGNGYIYANHVNFNTGVENPTIANFITDNGDGWSRKSSLAHVKNQIRGVADGTWGISITGNAATASSTPYPVFSSDAVSKDDITTRTDSGFYQSDSGTTAEGWPLNDSTWQHLIACTHSNDANYYSMQIAASFYSQNWYFRNTNGSGTTAWSTMLHSGNYNSYSPTLAGGGASGTWGISITGAASSASSLTSLIATNQSSTNTASMTNNYIGYSSSLDGGPIYGQSDGAIYHQFYSASWQHQIYGDYRTGQIALRGRNNGTWQPWRAVLDAGNFNGYAPTLTGAGASGTWGISITGSSASTTGNAATATTLQTARTINGTSFNGSANITTASWGTARTLTIGSTGKSVDGSGNVSWSLAEIGAQASLGFTPVQQGGGTGQGTNKVYVGWLGTQLGLQVDATNFGGTWPIGITGNAATVTNGVYTSGDQSIGGNKTFTGTTNLSGLVGVGGATPLASTTSPLQVGGDISLLGGSAHTLHFNSYYTTSWRARVAGFASAIRVDTTEGGIQFWGSPSSVAADANSNIAPLLRITPAGGIDGYGAMALKATAGQLTLEATGSNSVSIRTNGVERLRAYGGGGVLITGGELFVARSDSTSEGGQINFARSVDNATMYAIDVFGSTTTPAMRFINVSAGTTLGQFDSSGNLSVVGDTTSASQNGGQLAGLRNRVINGKMDIAQRGTSFAAAANGAYTLDRWAFAYASSAVSTVSQQADVPSGNEFQNSLRVAVTTADTSIAAGDYAHLAHRIEGFNVRDLIGRTFVLAFWARSSKTGVHCVALRNSGSDRSYVAQFTINAANTWEFERIVVSGGLITAGTWNWGNGVGLDIAFVLAAGTTYQTTPDGWRTGNFLATSSQVNVLDTVGNIFAVTGVQVEAGSVATPFEHRSHGVELALCRRYFQADIIVSVGGGATPNVSNRSWLDSAQFGVPMRAAPTMALQTTITASNMNAGSWEDITASSARYYATNSSANDCARIERYSASAEL